ncbi:MAG: hypothetical protein KJ065_18520 [Anaerolineae bacterium]|nr:hypothetical protein [Anaerolineae bacterium]
MTDDTRRQQRFSHYKAAARGLAWRAFAWILFSLAGVALGALEAFGPGGFSRMILYVASAGLIAGVLALARAFWWLQDSAINRVLDQEDARAAEARSRFY